MRVLLLENDPLVANTLKRMLGTLGHEAECASQRSDQPAISMLNPDRIILDIKKSDAVSMQILKELRQGADEVPVIVITARGFSGHTSFEVNSEVFEDTIRLAGASCLLHKPFTLSELRRALAASQ